MSQLHNFVIKSASGLILAKEQISVVPAKGCRKNLKRHPDAKVKHIRYEEVGGDACWTSTRLNGKGQPTMADVLSDISQRQTKARDKGGTPIRTLLDYILGGTR